MNRIPLPLPTLAVAALTVVAACQAGNNALDKPPSDHPTVLRASKTPEPKASPPSGGNDISLSDARSAQKGKDYTLLGSLVGDTVLTDSHHHLEIGGGFTVGSTGKLIAALDPTRLKPGGPIPFAMAIIKPSTRIATLLTHFGGPADTRRGTSGITANSGWIAWTSSKSSDILESDPWMLFSYDRRSGLVRRLAAAPHNASGVNPTAPGYTLPTLAANGRIYLDVVRQVGPNSYENDVDSIPADGSGGLRREVIGTGPVASGHNLVYDGDTKRLVIHERNLTTRHDTVLFDTLGTSCPKIFGLGLAGPIVAWGLRCGHDDIVQVLRNGHALATIHGHRLGYLRVTSAYVAFASGSGPYHQYVYDIGASQLLTIGNRGWASGDMPGNGRYLTWTRAQHGGFPGATYVVRLKR